MNIRLTSNKNKMQRKAIRAELRKESQTFPGYFKYEIDIQEEDGSITKAVPAYGKDLQDALQRTVHKNKVERAEQVFEKLPNWLYITIFGIYMTAVSLASVNLQKTWPIFTGIGLIIVIILGLQYFMSTKEIKD